MVAIWSWRRRLPGLVNMPKVIPLGYYLVAFVDIVGRHHEPGRPHPLLETAEDRRQVECILRETSAYAREMRVQFDRLCARTSGQTGLPTISAADRCPPRGQGGVSHAWRMGFAGSCTLAVPFWKRRSHGAYGIDIYRCLAGMCGLFVWALLRHRPLLGAVDVGLGTEMDHGEVYGTANTRVMELERLAGYPRILVGDGLLDCLEALAKTHPATREELHSRSLAERCRGFITIVPVDRASILDPLGEEMRSLGLYSSADIERLHEYVASQALRFSGPHGPGQTAPGCDEAEASRLRVYYARLLAYLEPRLHLWRR
jgi:hypothetical protein